MGFTIPRDAIFRKNIALSVTIPSLTVDSEIKETFKDIYKNEIEEFGKLKDSVSIEEGNLWIPLRNYERYKNDERAVGRVVCKLCDDVILTRNSIKIHIIAQHWKIKLFKCLYCLDREVRYVDFNLLWHHIEETHNMSSDL